MLLRALRGAGLALVAVLVPGEAERLLMSIEPHRPARRSTR
jgi:hypothetical protein